MRQRTLLSFAGLLVVILIGAAATQAEGYHFRYVTPVPSITCTMTGPSSITIGVIFYHAEWNLPVGATRDIYQFANGALTSHTTDSAFAGYSGSLTGGYTITGISNYPVTYVIRIDTIVDGKVVYRSTLTISCTGDGAGTATITNEDFSGACIALPDGSVVGDMPFQTQAYYEPGKVSPGVFINPGTYWVIGEDDSGQYYEIMLSCQYLWVPVDSMQPSYQAPWSGQPLPTRVVK